ncbi:MAG TPA: TIGR03364 family FAD-dependent oxidoreductase [Planctomycetaceae bacterium]|nr:TIGR03364 family FAD-dependent oxidoreductase [Planctomycetaceae bacterium]
MTPSFDVAVIGGGIAGLAHAWMAARRGLRVLVLERTVAAEGASIRNFGMVWPIGQPAGELHRVALRARDFWLELGSLGVLPVEPCGSIHLAHRDDEAAVLEEFCGLQTHRVRMLTPAEVLKYTPLANADGLQAGMHSSAELRVDPRIASRRIAAWLAETQGVECQFGGAVTAIDDRVVHASDGRTWRAERVIICSGSDLQTLFPAVFAQSGLRLCKLQMLKAAAQAAPIAGTPHLASGLTLRHYSAFANCQSLARVQTRVEQETPELNRFGIHVMASATAAGEVILGDSHEYGDDIAPFDKAEIDDLILRESRRVFRLDNWNLSQRWHGVYAKHPQLPVFEHTVADGVHLFVGLGGAGMTMSFGLAERAWQRW